MKFKIHDIVRHQYEFFWVKNVFPSVSEVRLEDAFGNMVSASFDDCEFKGRADNWFDFLRFIETNV